MFMFDVSKSSSPKFSLKFKDSMAEIKRSSDFMSVLKLIKTALLIIWSHECKGETRLFEIVFIFRMKLTSKFLSFWS